MKKRSQVKLLRKNILSPPNVSKTHDLTVFFKNQKLFI